jgi:prevent-host-death family protein
MASVTLRELARNTAAVIQAIEASGRPALVTRNGRPVAALVPVDESALEDWLLQRAGAFTRAVAEADPALSADRVRTVEWQEARGDGNGEPAAKPKSPRGHLRGSHRGK